MKETLQHGLPMVGFIYLIFINLLTCIIYGIDKRRAIKDKYRIPEKTLIGAAMIGGSIGALLGMKLFHHKTRKKKFSIGVPFILLMQIILIVLCIFGMRGGF